MVKALIKNEGFIKEGVIFKVGEEVEVSESQLKTLETLGLAVKADGKAPVNADKPAEAKSPEVKSEVKENKKIITNPKKD